MSYCMLKEKKKKKSGYALANPTNKQKTIFYSSRRCEYCSSSRSLPENYLHCCHVSRFALVQRRHTESVRTVVLPVSPTSAHIIYLSVLRAVVAHILYEGRSLHKRGELYLRDPPCGGYVAGVVGCVGNQSRGGLIFSL